jgi:exo-beta-1,3-glucanase (GH17 family)
MELRHAISPRHALTRVGAWILAILAVNACSMLTVHTVRADAVVHGLGFSPYMDGQAPPDFVTEQQIRDRLSIVAVYADRIRNWGMRSGLEAIPRIATDEFGLSVAACAFLDGDLYGDGNDEIQKNNLIAAAIAGHVDVAIVGTEALVSGLLTADELIAHLDDVRQRLDDAGFGRGSAKFIPVATAEPFGTWANDQPGSLFYREGGILVNGEVLEHIDLLFIHIYPFHEGVHINSAITELSDLYRGTRAAVDEFAVGLPIIIGETGWPSAGDTNILAEPTLLNAERYFYQSVAWAAANDIGIFYFEAFDENWKPPGYANVEKHWGVHYADGAPKFYIPEPSTETLLTTGLATLVFLAYTRRKARSPAL